MTAAQRDKFITAAMVIYAVYTVVTTSIAWGRSEQAALYRTFGAMSSVLSAVLRFVRPVPEAAVDYGFVQGLLSLAGIRVAPRHLTRSARNLSSPPGGRSPC